MRHVIACHDLHSRDDGDALLHGRERRELLARLPGGAAPARDPALRQSSVAPHEDAESFREGAVAGVGRAVVVQEDLERGQADGHGGAPEETPEDGSSMELGLHCTSPARRKPGLVAMALINALILKPEASKPPA